MKNTLAFILFSTLLLSAKAQTNPIAAVYPEILEDTTKSFLKLYKNGDTCIYLGQWVEDEYIYIEKYKNGNVRLLYSLYRGKIYGEGGRLTRSGLIKDDRSIKNDTVLSVHYTNYRWLSKRRKHEHYHELNTEKSYPIEYMTNFSRNRKGQINWFLHDMVSKHRKTSKSSFYWRNGNVRKEIHYNGQWYHGPWRKFYRSGQLKVEDIYDEMKLIKRVKYAKDGTVKSTESF